MAKHKPTPPTQAQMDRWMADLDAIRDEMAATGDYEMQVLAEHTDSVSACLEARQYASGAIVEWKPTCR